MLLIAGGALAAIMSGVSVSAGQGISLTVPDSRFAASTPAFLTLKQGTLPGGWTSAPQAVEAVDLLAQFPGDPTALLPMPTAGAALYWDAAGAAPRLPGVRGDWTGPVLRFAEPIEAAELSSSPVAVPGSDDQGWPGVAAGLDPAGPVVAPPQITAQPPTPTVTVRDDRPVVYESGNPSAPPKPSFRLLCDTCSGLHYALNYLDHGQRSLSQYSFTEAVIVNVLQLGRIAMTGSGQMNLVELNF